MIRVAIRNETEIPVGRAAGVIFAGVDEIYPLVGRYSSPEIRERNGGHRVLWRQLAATITGMCERIAPVLPGRGPGHNPSAFWTAFQVTCNETMNNPALIEAGRIAVEILIQPSRTVETCGGTFILGRARIREHTYMEVEYIPLARMD